MTHIEEHILELYVLGSRKVEGKRGEIALHLGECAGCKALADEMTSFYREVRSDFAGLQEGGELQRALVRTRRNLEPVNERFGAPIPSAHTTTMGRFRYFVYKHPFVSGGGVFAFGAAAVMALNLLMSSNVKDTNPAKFTYEPGTLQIYNKEDEKLWQLVIPELGRKSPSDMLRLRMTAVQDLDNDGKNEVLTCLSPAGEESPNRSLRIYNATKSLRRKVDFRVEFSYKNRVYTPDFGVNRFLVGDFARNGITEIFVSAANVRSPGFLARLDGAGNVVGRYWHFGGIVPLDTVDVNHDGKPEILLGGINDVDDLVHQETGVIIVLDPSRIVGDGKSGATPGYAFGESEAEIYYVQLPRSDMDQALQVNASPFELIRGTDNSLTVGAWSNEIGDYRFNFDYVFSSDMRILRVKSNNGTDRVRRLLVDQGKLKRMIDDEYLENLKEGVRYWDGKEWRKEVTVVKHGES